MKISHITNSYFTENNAPKTNFGRLIVKDNVPIEIAHAALKSKGVRKLAQLFHNIGKDVTVSYDKNPKPLGEISSEFVDMYMKRKKLSSPTGYSVDKYNSLFEYETIISVNELPFKKFGNCSVDYWDGYTIDRLKNAFDSPRKLAKFKACEAQRLFDIYLLKLNNQNNCKKQENSFKTALAAFNKSLNEVQPPKSIFSTILTSVGNFINSIFQ